MVFRSASSLPICNDAGVAFRVVFGDDEEAGGQPADFNIFDSKDLA